MAPTLKHWCDWCDEVGGKVADSLIDPTQVMAQFIRPETLSSWPDRPVLAVEWPHDAAWRTAASLTFSFDGESVAADDVGLEVTRHAPGGPVRLDVVTERWRAGYELMLDSDGMRLRPAGDREVFVATSRRERPLSEVHSAGLTVVLGGDAVVVPPGLLLAPRRDLPRYDRAALRPLDWTGVVIRNESRRRGEDEATVQGLMLARLRAEDWQVVIDDDGPGEVADLVALSLDGDTLRVHLVHCKYAGGKPGARVDDLYEVCGQAHKSVAAKSNPQAMLERLLRRARRRAVAGKPTGIEKGHAEDRQRMLGLVANVRVRLDLSLAQPGLSVQAASTAQLDLVAATEADVSTTAAASLTVYCSV